MREDVQEELLTALANCSSREKLVLVGLYVEGFSFRALAAKLGVSARTIQRLRNSGVKAIREAFSPEVAALFPEVPSEAGNKATPITECGMCGSYEPIGGDGLCGRCGPTMEETGYAHALGRAR